MCVIAKTGVKWPSGSACVTRNPTQEKNANSLKQKSGECRKCVVLDAGRAGMLANLASIRSYSECCV
jgi:hypothetical protein